MKIIWTMKWPKTFKNRRWKKHTHFNTSVIKQNLELEGILKKKKNIHFLSMFPFLPSSQQFSFLDQRWSCFGGRSGQMFWIKNRRLMWSYPGLSFEGQNIQATFFGDAKATLQLSCFVDFEGLLRCTGVPQRVLKQIPAAQ